MSFGDNIGYMDETPSCAVCGKNVTYGGGFSRINHKGIMVNLCCPSASKHSKWTRSPSWPASLKSKFSALSIRHPPETKNETHHKGLPALRRIKGWKQRRIR